MPRPKARDPKSLFETCVYSVVRHLAFNYNSTLATASAAKDAEDEEKSAAKCFKYFNNPFEALPKQLLSPINDSLYINKWLDMKHGNMLLTSKTTRLDCSRTGWNLRLWSERNGRVVSLSLIFCNLLQSNALNAVLVMERGSTCSLGLACYRNLLSQFKNLQVLDVASCRHFDDSCLHILGIHCPDLRELTVTESKITDDGIKALCGVTDQMSMGQEGGGCKFLEKLLITRTDVTPKGVEIALRHFPHLKILESPYVIEALDSLYQNYSFLPHQFKLTELYVSHHHFKLPFIPFANGAVHLAAWLCQNVTQLGIFFYEEGITDSDLLGLVTLTKLREIKIYLGYSVRVTFEGGLAPLLEAVGSSLKSLDLTTISRLFSMRTDSLIEYCPNLERLSLNCSYQASALRDEPSPLLWRNLKELNLSVFGIDISANDLNLILSSSSPALRSLHVSYCISLNDDLLQRVFQHHSFETLEELNLSFCSVSKKGIDLFMTEGNSLRKLVLVHFDHYWFAEEDLESLRENGKMNGWDLEVIVKYA